LSARTAARWVARTFGTGAPKDVGFRGNPNAGSFNTTTGLFTGNPTQIFSSGVRSPITSGGLWYQTVGAPPTLQVNDLGTANVTYNPGVGNQSFWANTSRGDGRRLSQYTNLRASVNRTVYAGAMKFAINDDLNFTADASYGEVSTLNRTAGFGTDTTFAIGNIQADNAVCECRAACRVSFWWQRPSAC
jgi:hypothetical protein